MPVKAAQTVTRRVAKQEVGQESRDGWDIQKLSLGTTQGREPLPGIGHPDWDLLIPSHPSPTLQAWALEKGSSDLPA